MRSVVDIVEKFKPYFSKYVYFIFKINKTFVIRLDSYSFNSDSIKLIDSFQARNGLVLQVGRYRENCRFICGLVS